MKKLDAVYGIGSLLGAGSRRRVTVQTPRPARAG